MNSVDRTEVGREEDIKEVIEAEKEGRREKKGSSWKARNNRDRGGERKIEIEQNRSAEKRKSHKDGFKKDD
jgi:membrane protein implicated in regulation of membrane protease activity